MGGVGFFRYDIFFPCIYIAIENETSLKFFSYFF